MADARPVLVVTALNDPTADLVIAELNARAVPVARFDAADFPHDLVMSAKVGNGSSLHGRLVTPSRTVDLSAVRAVYYRRPSGFSFGQLDEQDARFAVAQARYGLGGVLASLPGCLYVNHPHAIADAEFKPAQLATAVALGFTVPPTMITNDPGDAQAFAAEHGRVVYKPLWSTSYQVDGQAGTVWVREVAARELDAAVAGTAHLFQALVDKTADLRVTVIGETIFCVRIDSGIVDWRRDYSRHTYTAVPPPTGLAEAMRAYLGRFGLVFGCFDFALTPGGDPVFLECNPNGQWAWLQGPTGLPMAAALADLMEAADDNGR